MKMATFPWVPNRVVRYLGALMGAVLSLTAPALLAAQCQVLPPGSCWPVPAGWTPDANGDCQPEPPPTTNVEYSPKLSEPNPYPQITYLPLQAAQGAITSSCARYSDNFNAAAHQVPGFGSYWYTAWDWNGNYSATGETLSEYLNAPPDYPGYVRQNWAPVLDCYGTWWRVSNTSWCSSGSGCPGSRYRGESYTCSYNTWCYTVTPVSNDGRGAATLVAYCPVGYSGIDGSTRMDDDKCVLVSAAAVMKPSDGICTFRQAGAGYEQDPLDPDCTAGLQCSAGDKNLGGATCDDFVGNPVHSGTGNKYAAEVDYASAGTGLPKLIRHYNGQASDGSRIGRNWRMFAFIEALSPTSIRAKRPDGRSLTYSLQNGVWASDSDVNHTLKHLVDAGGNTTGWQLWTAADEVETYGPDGWLASVLNRSGSGYAVTWDFSGGDSTVIDMLGRTLVVRLGTSNVNTITIRPAD